MNPTPLDGTILILGATGAVGQELLSILAARNWPADRLRLVASQHSAGNELPYLDRHIVIERLEPDVFRGVTLVLSAASSEVAQAWLPIAVESGATVIDNSSYFRHLPDVPLVIPEVNGDELLATEPAARLIANPNCSTILLLVATNPLRSRFGVDAIDVCTYQAVSGAGLAGMDELRGQAQAQLSGSVVAPEIFPEPCAFNVFTHESQLDVASGLNGEEQKMIAEVRRIWGQPDLALTPTCVRVPVFRAHSQAVTVTLSTPVNLDEVLSAFDGAPGIRIVDDRERQIFPTPLAATGLDDVLVGRFRPDPGSRFDQSGRTRRWCLFLSGDQLRKGAALNAVQIADLIGLCTTAAASPNSVALKQRSPTNVLNKNGSPEIKQAPRPATVGG